MKVEICCKEMLEEWNLGNLYVENGLVTFDGLSEIKFCPYCGEKFETEVIIKNKVKE